MRILEPTIIQREQIQDNFDIHNVRWMSKHILRTSLKKGVYFSVQEAKYREQNYPHLTLDIGINSDGYEFPTVKFHKKGV